MAQIQDQLLLAKADLSQAREISKNITDEKVNAFIREVQLIEVRAVLGAELYLLLEQDYDGTVFATQKYANLWDGVDYTTKENKSIRYYGLKPYAVYMVYYRMLLQQQTNVSRFGVESVQNEISEDQSAGTVRGKAKEAHSVAVNFLESAKEFLYNEGQNYPEYGDNNSPLVASSTALKFFRV